MKKMLIMGLIFILPAITFIGCTNKKLTEDEKLKIAIEVVAQLKTESKIVDPNTDLSKLQELISLEYEVLSDVITVPDARGFHQKYLKSKNPILDSNGKIVHYLTVEDGDLDTLSKYAVGGIRLYFLQEGKSFSIAMVAVGADGTNVLNPPNEPNRSLVVNKLDPCPDACFTEPGTTRNHQSDLNFNPTSGFWLKPNIRQGLNFWANADNVIQED